MMDLKEIIRWLFPCFRIKLNFSFVLILICLGFLNNCSAEESSVKLTSIDAKYSFNSSILGRDSDVNSQGLLEDGERRLDVGTARTFGRPLKKMMAGLMPVIFSIGAASTWAVVATVIGFKTLLVTLLILKILLMAGAAKFGALFATKSHHGHHQEWTPQKEIHLHIHNGGHHEIPPHVEHDWSRDGVIPAETKNVNVVAAENLKYFGPQTVSTPYGNYVRVDSLGIARKIKKKKRSIVTQ